MTKTSLTAPCEVCIIRVVSFYLRSLKYVPKVTTHSNRITFTSQFMSVPQSQTQFSGLEQGLGLYTILTHPGSSFPTGQQLSTDTRLLPIQQGKVQLFQQ